MYASTAIRSIFAVFVKTTESILKGRKGIKLQCHSRRIITATTLLLYSVHLLLNNIKSNFANWVNHFRCSDYRRVFISSLQYNRERSLQKSLDPNFDSFKGVVENARSKLIDPIKTLCLFIRRKYWRRSQYCRVKPKWRIALSLWGELSKASRYFEIPLDNSNISVEYKRTSKLLKVLWFALIIWRVVALLLARILLAQTSNWEVIGLRTLGLLTHEMKTCNELYRVPGSANIICTRAQRSCAWHKTLVNSSNILCMETLAIISKLHVNVYALSVLGIPLKFFSFQWNLKEAQSYGELKWGQCLYGWK